LGTLFFASQFIDLLWPFLLLAGIEYVEIDPGNTAFTPLNFIYYPFSHGFVSVLIWGFLVGLVYYLIKKNLKISLLLGFLVVSHWLLDLIVHRSDLPMFPGSEIKAGFGLWNSVILTIIIEGGIFILGIYFYLKMTEAKNKVGTYAFWGLIAFLVIIYITNITSPPPPSSEAIGYVGLSQWLLVLWGYWIDKNRITAKQELL
jgi:hypothetical protein